MASVPSRVQGSVGLGGQWGPGLWNQRACRFPMLRCCAVCVANMGKADGSDTVDLRAGGRTEEKPRHPEPLLESRPPAPPAQSILSLSLLGSLFSSLIYSIYRYSGIVKISALDSDNKVSENRKLS